MAKRINAAELELQEQLVVLTLPCLTPYKNVSLFETVYKPAIRT